MVSNGWMDGHNRITIVALSSTDSVNHMPKTNPELWQQETLRSFSFFFGIES